MNYVICYGILSGTYPSEIVQLKATEAEVSVGQAISSPYRLFRTHDLAMLGLIEMKSEVIASEVKKLDEGI